MNIEHIFLYLKRCSLIKLLNCTTTNEVYLKCHENQTTVDQIQIIQALLIGDSNFSKKFSNLLLIGPFSVNLLGQILNNVVMHEQFGSNGAATFARYVINRMSSYETSTLPRKNEVSPSHHSYPLLFSKTSVFCLAGPLMSMTIFYSVS